MPVKVGRLLEKCREAGNTDIMGWRPWVSGDRNPGGEGGGGPLSGHEQREVGSVWGETQGLLAWVLVEALFSTRMKNTQVSALYFDGKLYLCYSIFLKLHVSVKFNSVQSLSHV